MERHNTLADIKNVGHGPTGRRGAVLRLRDGRFRLNIYAVVLTQHCETCQC